MASLPINFDPYNPIPNTPFYSPSTSYLQGPFGPLVIGSGLSISPLGVISSSGGSGGGTVTAVTAGSGLSGGTITSTGTIAIAATGVVAGSYTFPALSVNARGQVTSISSGFPVLTVSANAPLVVTGSPQLPVISVVQASVTGVGVTQLNNTTSSTLTNQALTAAAGKNLQDQINSLAQNANGLNLAGTLDAATGLVVTATTAGITSGITAGNPLPSPGPALDSFYLIVTTAAATYTPPGSPAISNVLVGDYIICSAGVWTILRVGPITGAYATTTTAGVVELATSSEAIAGVNPNTVLTPQTGAATYIPKNIITSQGQLITGTGSGTFTALSVGIDGYVLAADSSCPAGMKWSSTGTGGGGGITSLQFNAPLTASTNPVTSGVAAVDATYASTAACGVVQLADVAATQAGVSALFAVTPAGGAASYVQVSSIAAKGELFVGTANDSYGLLAPGADGQSLVACSACTTGLTWGSSLTPATPVVAGAVFGLPYNAGLNTSVGCQALLSVSTGTGNTALGYGAGALVSSGSCNSVQGTAALAAETTGSFNTALGTGALCAQNGASNNTATGFGAGNSLTSGFSNSLFGSCAGDNLSTGCCNVFVGAGAGLANTTSCNVVVVGSSGTSSTPTVNNEANVWAGTTVARFAQGGVAWTFTSDARRKENVADLALGLDFLSKVTPRMFNWKEDGRLSAGFIAQELDEVVQEFGADYLGVVSKADPDCYTVGAAALIPVLVNAVKELAAEVAALKAKLD